MILLGRGARLRRMPAKCLIGAGSANTRGRETVETKGACVECSKDKAPPKDAKAIGERVSLVSYAGRGYNEAAHAFSQCPRCGSVWLTSGDSGVGGKGTVYRRLTKDLY